MKLSSEPFRKITRKEKVIESRLYDEKRQTIQLGDEIEFSENDHPENKVQTKVIGLLRYRYFTELFKDHDPSLFGGENRDFLLQEIKRFYSDEDEMRYGVIGLRVEVAQ